MTDYSMVLDTFDTVPEKDCQSKPLSVSVVELTSIMLVA